MPSGFWRGARAWAMAFTPSSPISLSAQSEHRDHNERLPGQGMALRGAVHPVQVGVPPNFSSVNGALAQLPSGFWRGARAWAMAFAPSSPILFPAQQEHMEHSERLPGQCTAPQRRMPASANLRTTEVQVRQRGVGPAAVGVLARSQSLGKGLCPVRPNLVACTARSTHNTMRDGQGKPQPPRGAGQLVEMHVH